MGGDDLNGNQIIALNTAYLYLRLIITSIVGLYSARLLILELGVDDFGLFAVIGGIVALSNILNTTMVNTTNRFISFELGKSNEKRVNNIFNQLLRIHFIFGIILLLLIETLGKWYVNNYLNVAENKIPSAIFVLHTVSLSTFFLAISMPYQGVLTAMEKFKIRSILELFLSFLNLLAIILVQFTNYKKLEYYSLFLLIAQALIAASYVYYGAKIGNTFTKIRLKLKTTEYYSILRYFFWQLIYVVGSVGTMQGIVFLINRFFGNVINAAYGISSRVQELVYSFVKTLNQAATPQIIKNIGMGNDQRSIYLLYKLPRITFLIMVIPAIPLLIFLDPVLSLWLKHVPEFTAWFVALRITHGLISTLESGFEGAIDATGHIRFTKSFFSILFLSVIPIGYFLFESKTPPHFIILLMIIAEIIFIFFQISVLSKYTSFSIISYYQNSIAPILRVVILCSPLFLFRLLLPISLINMFVLATLTLIIIIMIVFFIGLTKTEQQALINVIRNKLYDTSR